MRDTRGRGARGVQQSDLLLLAAGSAGTKLRFQIAAAMMNADGTPIMAKDWTGFPWDWEVQTAGDGLQSKVFEIPMNAVSRPLLIRAVQGEDLFTKVHPLRKHRLVSADDKQMVECLYHGTMRASLFIVLLEDQGIVPGTDVEGRGTLISPNCPEDIRQLDVPGRGFSPAGIVLKKEAAFSGLSGHLYETRQGSFYTDRPIPTPLIDYITMASWTFSTTCYHLVVATALGKRSISHGLTTTLGHRLSSTQSNGQKETISRARIPRFGSGIEAESMGEDPWWTVGGGKWCT